MIFKPIVDIHFCCVLINEMMKKFVVEYGNYATHVEVGYGHFGGDRWWFVNEHTMKVNVPIVLNFHADIYLVRLTDGSNNLDYISEE